MSESNKKWGVRCSEKNESILIFEESSQKQWVQGIIRNSAEEIRTVLSGVGVGWELMYKWMVSYSCLEELHLHFYDEMHIRVLYCEL